MLFSNDQVAAFVTNNFEPCWEMVRPVPIVRIDFGNGTVVTRTLHGNIASYACNSDGQVLDVLPGIYNVAGYLEGGQPDDNQNDLPITIPVATQLPHAVGLAYAAQYRGDEAVVMAFCGDGATSEGDFHEAVNFAGVWHVPVVFVIQNTQNRDAKAIHLKLDELLRGVRGARAIRQWLRVQRSTALVFRP